MNNASWVIPGWFKFGGLFFDPTVTPSSSWPSPARRPRSCVSGLVAERIKFNAVILFTLVRCGIL